MGQAIADLVQESKGFELIGGFEGKGKADAKVDGLIDFSSPEGFVSSLGWCLENKIPFVTGGTGLYIKALLHGLFRTRPINPEIISKLNNELENEIRERLKMAGISVIEARINFIAYSEEIAGAMLRRQQATAVDWRRAGRICRRTC